MIKSISCSIITLLIKKDIIHDEINIYQYGLEQLISSIIGVTIIFFISLFSNRLLDGIIYLVSFIVIRKYTGGYHCKTYFTCKLSFIGTFIVYLILTINLNNNLMVIGAFIFSFLIIWFLSPCDHENKVLTKAEIYHYKKISKGILCMYFLIIYILYYYASPYVIHFEMMVIIIAILLIIGKIERRKSNEKN